MNEVEPNNPQRGTSAEPVCGADVAETNPETMRALVDRLNETARAYYVLDCPLISDKEWDALYERLARMEAETGNVLDDSPTRRVGGEPLDAFAPHRHETRLLSMDKAQTEGQLREWAARAQRLWETAVGAGSILPPISYAVEYKFDGINLSLIYENGALVTAATRGNGEIGEEITEQARTIQNIPLRIPFGGRLVAQGEGIMRLSVLAEYNKTAGEPLKNARNGAAGALRNLDPRVTRKRRLDAFFYGATVFPGADIRDHARLIGFLSENGFMTSPLSVHAETLDQVIDTLREIEADRGKLDFLIDGAVVKIADFATRDALGATDKFPRWAVAYKFEAEETTTTLLGVTWEPGRTGRLTPLAHLEPAELAGVTVRRATLNNWGDIQKKRVKIGCRVFVRRSNDVIPEILGRAGEPSPDEREIELPAECPACGATAEMRGAHLYCTGGDCKPRLVAALAHFAGRDAMDIDTFSEKTAALLYDRLSVRDPADLFALQKDNLTGLPGMGDKKAENLLAAVESAKRRPLDAFIFALGIPGVGRKTARDLASRFGTLSALQGADAEALLAIPEVGEINAQNITEFFSDTRQAETIMRLLALGVDPVPAEETPEGVFTGMTVVVTGTLASMSRQEAEKAIGRAGGKAAGSVSGKTTLVVAGESAGSKKDKAEALGVRVIGETEFLAMLGTEAPLG